MRCGNPIIHHQLFPLIFPWAIYCLFKKSLDLPIRIFDFSTCLKVIWSGDLVLDSILGHKKKYKDLVNKLRTAITNDKPRCANSSKYVHLKKLHNLA